MDRKAAQKNPKIDRSWVLGQVLSLLLLCLPQALQAMKILVLVIASDNEPRYPALQRLWQSYMHYDPQHVEAYLIRADPNLQTSSLLEGDVLWSQGKECIKPGILMKTIASLEYFLPRLEEFDFVIRTNLSSFFIFPRLLKYLETLPKTGAYAGPKAREDVAAASGCGIILSTDVAKLLLAQKGFLSFMKNYDYDDIVIGRVLAQYAIRHKPSQFLFLTSHEAVSSFKSNPSPQFFHFRVGDPELYIELIRTFYTNYQK